MTTPIQQAGSADAGIPESPPVQGADASAKAPPDFPRLADRCPVPECDRPLHTGLHEDAEGFRWGPGWQIADPADQEREDAKERALEGMA